MIVWDEKRSSILQTTKGGYPHITLAYTGKHLHVEQLVRISGWVMQEWALKSITITHARVNSFRKEDGTERHDVLLDIAEAVDIEKSRQVYLCSKFENADMFSMNEPHITHSIYATRKEAERVRDLLNESAFPYKVNVTGVTID